MIRALLGRLIAIYRRSPLYPGWGQRMARWLGLYHRWIGRGSDGLVSRRVDGFLLSLDLTEVIDNQLYYSGTFDPESVGALRALVGAGDTVVDIGANIGWMTLQLARQVGPTGHVLAFEPTPRAHARLEENVAANGFQHVEAVALALGNHVQGPRPVRIRSTYRLDGVDDTEEALIATTTLDEYLRGHPAGDVRFLKIDTDGRELAVIQGAVATLKRYRPTLLFEVGPDSLRHFGATPDALLGQLRAHGYRFLHAGRLEPYPDVESAAAHLPPETSINVVAVPIDAPASEAGKRQRPAVSAVPSSESSLHSKGHDV